MHEFSRDILLAELPSDLAGAPVLDVGCGEGLLTRALAVRGAIVTGVDPAVRMIGHAQRTETVDPLNVRYRVDDGSTLSTVADASVEWVTAALSLNNIPDLNPAFTAINRVLRPAGHLVFTVPHPCFDAPNASSDVTQGTLRRRVGDYLAEGFWRSGHPGSVRRAGNYHRMVSTYLRTLLATGFRIESIREPAPTPAVLESHPHRGELPPFLLVHGIAN